MKKIVVLLVFLLLQNFNTANAYVKNCKIKSTTTNMSLNSSAYVHKNLQYGETLTIQVLPVEFKNLKDPLSVQESISNFITNIDKFYNEASYGNLKINWVIPNSFFTMSKNIEEYKLKREYFREDPFMVAIQEAISISDNEIDYTNVDVVMVITPSNTKYSDADVSPAPILFPSNSYKTNEGLIYKSAIITGDARVNQNGWRIPAHELGHLIGLPDLYNFNAKNNDDQFIFLGNFDFMNHAMGIYPEMLVWNRWKLGFINDSNVSCVGSVQSTRFVYDSSSINNNKIIVVPLSNTKVIVAESRKKLNGLLVYLVDSTIDSGHGPIKILRPSNSFDPYYNDAILKVNEQIKYNNVTIKNLRNIKDGNVVKISIDYTDSI